MPEASNVTLAEAVAAQFVIMMLLACRPSNENTRLAEPSARPAVTTAHLRNSWDRWPIATLHPTDDSDVHVVISDRDAPRRSTDDTADVEATLAPRIVTLAAPVGAPFDRIGLLGPGASTVKVWVSVPCSSPTLATMARDRITVIADADDLTPTAESDVHSVSSVTDPPARRVLV
jgi:hypothetical protein